MKILAEVPILIALIHYLYMSYCVSGVTVFVAVAQSNPRMNKRDSFISYKIPRKKKRIETQFLLDTDLSDNEGGKETDEDEYKEEEHIALEEDEAQDDDLETESEDEGVLDEESSSIVNARKKPIPKYPGDGTRGTKLTLKEIQQALAMRKQNYSYADIARKLSNSYSVVRNSLLSCDEDGNLIDTKKVWSDAETSQALALKDQGMSTMDIAKKLQRSYNSVRNQLHLSRPKHKELKAWTERELDRAVALVRKHRSYDIVARELGRPSGESVFQKLLRSRPEACNVIPGALWSEKDMERLVSLDRKGLEPTQIAAKLGRSTHAIRVRLKRVKRDGIVHGPPMKVWSTEDLKKARRWDLEGLSYEQIAENLGRSIGSVRHKLEDDGSRKEKIKTTPR